MSAGHGTERRAAERIDGPLSRLAPAPKLVGLVVFLLVVAVIPPSRPAALALAGLVACGVAAAAYVEWRAVARRLVLDLPLAVLGVTYAVLGTGRRTTVLGVSLSSAGLRVGMALVAKATIGIVAVSAVAASTTTTEMVDGLRRLRLPDWFCDMVGLSARQVSVLRADVDRLRLAAAVRSGDRGRRHEWAVVGRTLGTTFVRSTERVERLQLAVQARGGDGLGAVVRGAGPAVAASVWQWLVVLAPAAAVIAGRVAL